MKSSISGFLFGIGLTSLISLNLPQIKLFFGASNVLHEIVVSLAFLSLSLGEYFYLKTILLIEYLILILFQMQFLLLPLFF
ncbi:hypothetical protein A6K25_09740 [Alteromonas stellipolaris]|nr:hypothetical protein A6K25_09740 [Alteromonas stellipolaris]